LLFGKKGFEGEEKNLNADPLFIKNIEGVGR